jgi:outer membrane protein TolC
LSSSNNENLLLVPIDAVAVETIEIPNLQESYAKSVANWPELRILQEKLNVAQLKVNFSKDQIKPQLDLVVNVNKRSLAKNAVDAKDSLIEDDYLSWSAGFEFSAPISNNYAEENYEIERLKYLQSNIELQQMKRTLNNGIHSKIISLKNDKSSFVEYLHGITFQDKLVNLEYQRLQLGKSSIVEMFEQQENLIQYERKMFNNIIDLKLSEAALQKASGILLEKFQIELLKDKNYELAKDAKYVNK